jgi:hypothetical protein
MDHPFDQRLWTADLRLDESAFQRSEEVVEKGHCEEIIEARKYIIWVVDLGAHYGLLI